MIGHNFNEISLQELRSYVLSHREDNTVFHIYVDRINTERDRITYPPLKSLEDMENYPDILDKLRRDAERNINPTQQ